MYMVGCPCQPLQLNVNSARVKTDLRNIIITVRMSGLGLLNMYGEKEISAETVLDIFTRKQSKWALLFQD